MSECRDGFLDGKRPPLTHPTKEDAMNNAIRCSTVSASVLAVLFVVGCGHESPPAKPPTALVTTSAPPPENAPKRKSDQVVNVSGDIRAACKIDDSDRSPKFDFDSTSLSSADRDVLEQVAKCLTTGPLKGRAVELVGRADARGETEYNMGLGETRATSVKKYLGGLGVDNTKMSETSRGELDATGKDEEGWRKDRRVDMRLKP
jgi:peptidoglycan-associated lipoprotein